MSFEEKEAVTTPGLSCDKKKNLLRVSTKTGRQRSCSIKIGRSFVEIRAKNRTKGYFTPDWLWSVFGYM